MGPSVHANSLWLTYLGVPHSNVVPAHDKIQCNKDNKDLAQPSGHPHAKFGGSSLPAGRARATRATAGQKGLLKFTLAISHLLGGRSCRWRAGPRKDRIKRTKAAPRPILWPCACRVCWLQLACRPSQNDQGNCWSKGPTAIHIGHFTLTLQVEHWCDPPEHEKIRWNGQRQHLAQCSDHAHAKFGGSNLPAGRARATKETGGPSGYSSSLWPIHTYFAGRALVWRAGTQQDTMKRTTAAPRPMLRPCACQVWWLQLACRPTRATKATGGPSGYSSSLWPIHTYFAGRALVWRAGPRKDTINGQR